MEQLVNLYNKAKTLNNNQLRKLIRSGDYIGQTAGLSKNMLQTNLIILEKQYALDFMIFCQRNPKACGVTPQNAILNSSVEFCISHTPGYMLITDIKEDAEIPILQ